MKYTCLKKNSIKDTGFEIRPIALEDIEQIRLWRNKQLDVLRQKKIITSSEQIFYYKNVLFPTFNQEFPDQIIFSYFKDNFLIGWVGFSFGSCGCY